MTLLRKMFAAALALAATPAVGAEPVRKSPYFIDGLHCEGLADVRSADQIKRNYASDEVAEVALRIQRQSWCENLFKQYDVEAFQWITPEGLENLAFALRHSRRFETVDISLEKSELQNHVHLIVRIKEWAPQTHYTVLAESAVERGTGDDGNRYSQRFAGSVDFAKRGPANPAPYVFDFDFRNSTARRPLSLSDLERGGNPVTLSPEETAAQAKPSGIYDHVDLRLNFQAYRSIDGFVTLGVDATGITGDSEPTAIPRGEAGVVLHTAALLQSTLTLSLLYSSEQVTADQVYPQGQNAASTGIVFAGARSSSRTPLLDIDFAFYRSLTEDLHGFGEINFLYKFANLFGFTEALGYNELVVRGAVLPEHRLGLPDRNEMALFLAASRDFTAFGADHSVTLKLGSSSYDSELPSTTPYSRRSPMAELDFKTHASTFDVDLALLYCSTRLY